MFFERVPITQEIGTTIAAIFVQYGIPQKRFNEIIKAPQNENLRRLAGASITPDTPLPMGSGAICLPIDFDVASYGMTIVDPQGLRPQQVGKHNQVLNRGFLQQCTHGVKVQLTRYYLDGTEPLPCNHIRWVQTVKKINNPFPNQPSEFVDGGGRSQGRDWPWYDIGVVKVPVTFEDNPCGPQAPASGKGLQFRATASAVVWTMDRITLVQCLTYGFTIKPGKTVGAVLWDPYLRKATDAEVQDQIRILKVGINQYTRPTGGNNLIYKQPPNDGSIN